MTSDAEITSGDFHKIKSIGWLVFDPSQRLDLLIESNTLIRAFLGKILSAPFPYHFDISFGQNFSLARGKHHAAVEVIEIIPNDARGLITAQWQDQVHLLSTYPIE